MGGTAIKKIYSDKVSDVYLFDRINEPNHPSDGMVKAALRDFLCRVPLSCKEPVRIYWNKSDTSTYAVVAVSFKEIGVDIEYMRERRFEAISRRYFHEDEITDDKEIFYDLWCQKEAYTKWKKGKIVNYMSQKIEKDMIELYNLPDNILGYVTY